VPLDAETSRIAFEFPLALNGSSAVSFAPFGRNTLVKLQGDSDDVSFRGNWLPAQRELGDGRFDASWAIPYLGRGYPQVLLPDSGGARNYGVNPSRFGLALFSSVDAYRMAARSVKYSFLFIVLTFTTVWLMEVLGDVRVHPMQYLLLGAALCLFYLLELSLAEHLGFAPAYVIASAAVVGMVGSYALVMLRTKLRALATAAGVATLYGYLYVLLMNEDYALLMGSVGLFAVLGAIMFATRRVDWYAVGRSPATP
jgi:inner membrane protein